MIRNPEKFRGFLGKDPRKALCSLAYVRVSAADWNPPLASQDHPTKGSSGCVLRTQC